jgi:hypothetical protein
MARQWKYVNLSHCDDFDTNKQNIVGDDGCVKVWDPVHTQELQQTIEIGNAILVLCWILVNPDVPSFLVGAADGTVNLFVYRMVRISFLARRRLI